VIGDPPSLADAVHVTVACPSSAAAVTDVAIPGTVKGVTAFDGVEAGPVPSELVGRTVNVYAVPAVRPVTLAFVAPLVEALNPPGADVTV
jgi:hypothetical protein